MILLPAIDIQNNKCVRLTKGKFESTITYSDNPLSMANSFEDEGAEFLHIIDLDGADNEQKNNKELIKSIAQNTNRPIQVGGGIRDLKTIKEYLNQGINRVIVGTMPFSNDLEFIQAIKQYKERIVVSLDCKDELVRINGWKNETKTNLFDMVAYLEKLGVQTIVVTDIDKDGMLEGPNISLYKRLAEKTSINIIASGGVTSLEDIKALSKLNLYGAIIGKAIYEGNVSLKEAIKCSRKE